MNVVMNGVVTWLVVLGAIVVVVAAIARPWELHGGSFLDKLRIGEAVSGYDFWLGWHGVSGRQRRALRAELRANLWEATQRVGAREAVRAIGPVRRLARDSVPERSGPLWSLGVTAGLIALELIVLLQLLITTVVADTAEAAGVPRLDVRITAVPGMTARYEQLEDGFSFGANLGPAAVVVGVLVFVLVARPWRLLRRTPALSAG